MALLLAFCWPLEPKNHCKIIELASGASLFKDKTTAAVFLGLPAKALPPELRKRARTKLEQVHLAMRLEDLRIPPANHLEPLKGNREGQHSIRINEQWRVCFAWRGGDAFDVEIVDYH